MQRTPKSAGEWSRLLSASVGDWYSPAASNLFTKRSIRITGDVFVEATEFGDVLVTGAAEPGLQLPFVQGVEVPQEDSRATDDQCGQAATLTFYTRIANVTEPPASPPVPAGSTGDGTPFDIPDDGEHSALKAPWEWDDIFTQFLRGSFNMSFIYLKCPPDYGSMNDIFVPRSRYRRARLGMAAPPDAHAAAHGGKVFVGDLTQQNWGGGNDLEGAYLVSTQPTHQLACD